MKEIDILKKCSHENIVKFFGSIKNGSDLWILMDFCAYGSLADVMKIIQRPFNEEELLSLVVPVIKGLAYLHSFNIIHRDFKSANILLTESMEPRIADFGVSAQIGDLVTKAKTSIGTPYFMSPEVLDGIPYNEKADIWSFGITVVELADGKCPHHGILPLRAMYMIVKDPPPTFIDPRKWSDNLNALLGCCLQKDPKGRATSKDLQLQPWCLQYNAANAKKTLANLAKVRLKYLESNR